jgi:hypothetical protein
MVAETHALTVQRVHFANPQARIGQEECHDAFKVPKLWDGPASEK